MRERLDIGQFRFVVFEMVEQWSVEYTSGLNSVNNGAPKIDLPLWTSGYNFAASNVKIDSKRKGNEITYTIRKGDASQTESIKETRTEWTAFKEFVESFEIVHVKFNYPISADNWNFACCDCAMGFKQYVCEHIVGIALRLKIVEAPAEAKNVPLNQRRKRGRPAKAKSSLQFQ